MAAIGGLALLMLLLLVANGTPVLLKRLLGERGAWPIDGGRAAWDGRPWLGRSKTWRGLLAGIAATALTATVLGLGPALGAAIGAAALVGDLASSFTKRRLAIASSGRATGIDQIPESLLPALVAKGALGLGWLHVLLAPVVFLVAEIALSRLLYRLKIRDEPY